MASHVSVFHFFISASVHSRFSSENATFSIRSLVSCFGLIDHFADFSSRSSLSDLVHGRRGLVMTRSAARGPQKKNARGLQRWLKNVSRTRHGRRGLVACSVFIGQDMFSPVDSPFETESLTVFFARFRWLSGSLLQTQFRTFHTMSACVSFGRWSLPES